MEKSKNSTTVEPVKEQAPVSPCNTSPAAAEGQQTPSSLPSNYLAGGYYRGEGRKQYIDPDLVGKTAQELAKALAAGGLNQRGFTPILRSIKKVNKKALPMEAKVGALIGAIPKVKLLEQRKRAPHLLLEVLEANKAAIASAEDYEAVYLHLEAVSAFLADYS